MKKFKLTNSSKDIGKCFRLFYHREIDGRKYIKYEKPLYRIIGISKMKYKYIRDIYYCLNFLNNDFINDDSNDDKIIDVYIITCIEGLCKFNNTFTMIPFTYLNKFHIY